jgi:membrane protein YqaA with SNARE-associated domain
MFLSPPGLLVLGALDSSVLFTAPLLVDTAVVVLVARRPALFWLYPLLATAGSVAGAAVTFAIGRRVGEDGLQRFADKRRIERAFRRTRAAGVMALAALGLVPPPFPFTAVILTAGALEVSMARFLGALAVFRALRFSLEALLALRYGRQFLAWLQSDLVRGVATGLVVLTVAAAVYSAVRLLRPGVRQHA